jgi:two-component system sensor histidine kinase UhpB
MDASIVVGGPTAEPPVRVLLVEDEDDHARLVRRALGRAETASFTVERAATGAEALTLAATGRYDALILDYRLPDMDGLELLGRLRTAGLHAPVLLMTSGGSEDLVARALRARVDDYLPKKVGLTGDVLAHAVLAMQERWRLVKVEERFGDLLQGLNASIWEADPTTLEYSFMSQPTEAMLGYPLAHWSTEPDFFVKVLHPEDREHALTTARAAIAEGSEIDDEYRLLAADGRVVWVHSVVRVVADAVGHPRLLRGVTVDITERKRAEMVRDVLLARERTARGALEQTQQQVVQQER